MELRTYRASSMQEALALVRQDLGPDAAVVHTREVGADGWLRFVRGARRIDFDEVPSADEVRSGELLVLDEALTLLEQHDPQAAQLVKLRFFAGFSHQEAAAALGITRRAADRLWALSKAWLYQHVADE